MKTPKPRSMAKILNDAKLRALGNKFIEKVTKLSFTTTRSPKQKAFNYSAFTDYCSVLAEETNHEMSGAILRDIVMEQIDPKFNRNNPTKFRGMDCIN